MNNEERNIIKLSLPSFLHSDLALRNCLLSANVSVKIGDYGLSRVKYKVCCIKHARRMLQIVIPKNSFHFDDLGQKKTNLIPLK